MLRRTLLVLGALLWVGCGAGAEDDSVLTNEGAMKSAPSVIATYVKGQAQLGSEVYFVQDQLVNLNNKPYRMTTIRISHLDNLAVVDDGMAGDFLQFGTTLHRYGSIDSKSVTATGASYAGQMLSGKTTYPFTLSLTQTSTGWTLQVNESGGPVGSVSINTGATAFTVSPP